MPNYKYCHTFSLSAIFSNMHILDTLIIFNLIWDCLALNKKAMSFEMSVRIHQSTWCDGSEDFNFHKYRCKSQTRTVNLGLYADLFLNRLTVKKKALQSFLQSTCGDKPGSLNIHLHTVCTKYNLCSY